jgi:hypothetical protein
MKINMQVMILSASSRMEKIAVHAHIGGDKANCHVHGEINSNKYASHETVLLSRLEKIAVHAHIGGDEADCRVHRIKQQRYEGQPTEKKTVKN